MPDINDFRHKTGNTSSSSTVVLFLNNYTEKRAHSLSSAAPTYPTLALTRDSCLKPEKSP